MLQLEHRAMARRSAILGRAEEVAAAVLDQPAKGSGAVSSTGKGSQVVRAWEPAATSNTVPSPEAPPPVVVPKRLPLLSSTRPASGLAPLRSGKGSQGSKGVGARCDLEHRAVIRRRRNLRSCRRGCRCCPRPGRHRGWRRSVPVKVARVVRAWVPAATSNTVPSFDAPPMRSCRRGCRCCPRSGRHTGVRAVSAR